MTHPHFQKKGKGMSEVNITVSDFKSAFPEFSSLTDAVLTRYLTQAQAYCSTTNFRIKPSTRVLAIQLLAGHLITLAKIDPTSGNATGAGSVSGFETSASVGGVSVSLQAPVARNAFETWINSTGYGQQYWALMTAVNPTGVHYVGNPRVFGIR